MVRDKGRRNASKKAEHEIQEEEEEEEKKMKLLDIPAFFVIMKKS